MAHREGEIENLAHAYRVLDVPWTASPRAIKTNYRKLVKRWHPDRHRPGTPGHTESTLMTGLLNEAYARIGDAPLRAGHGTPFSSGTRRTSDSNSARTDSKDEPDPPGSSRADYVPRDPSEDAIHDYRTIEKAREAGVRDDAARPFDWIGFAVRFVLGALFGALLSFRIAISLSMNDKASAVPPVTIATILLCGVASGLGGDAFWRAIRPRGMWWRGRWD
jgi:curved DNA-binding protein CbpA